METATPTKPKTQLADLSYDQLVKVRNELGVKITEADEVTKALKAKREKIDVELLKRFNEQGIQSAKTKYGTPYIVKRTSVSIADDAAFFAWVEETGNVDFLERRPAKTMIEAYMVEDKVDGEGNPVLDEKGQPKKNGLPPGLNWSAKNAIGVKK